MEESTKPIDKISSLAKRLSECPEVQRFDSEKHKEAWALADGFWDLHEAFDIFTNEHLPRLLNSTVRGEELVEVLLEIGEEFRTILWHIKASRFYRYVDSQDSQDDT